MAQPASRRGYGFAGFELHPDERRLMRGDAQVHLGGNSFDVLVALVERAGRLVTKEQLLSIVWGKVVVEENTLQQHVAALRKALGSQAIATVIGHGYRFVPEVTVRAVETGGTPRNNLPFELSSFIGRDADIEAVVGLLRDARLLTLTGSGGCGKTRLALRVARRCLADQPEGVWLVELAPLADAALVARAVASALGVKESPGAPLIETLAAQVATRQLLIVVDNAEHLIDACADIVAALLQRCPNLRMLVTSRERLRVDGEVTYRVPSLDVPEEVDEATPESIAAYDAARLFIERARARVPAFEVTRDAAASVASVCRRLDGIPLAIELAASRVNAFSVQAIGEQLDQRFELLVAGSRTVLPRHQTLRALIDWSVRLLSEEEQALLRGVSVFAGGWTLDAARSVCTTVASSRVPELLASLVDKSLVSLDQRDGQARYGMLETVLHDARDRLIAAGEEAPARDRHLHWCTELADEAGPQMRKSEQKQWLDRLAIEHDNLRAALAWARDGQGDVTHGLRAASALWRFWYTRGHVVEGDDWLVSLLEAAPPGVAVPVRAKALLCSGTMKLLRGEFEPAKARLEESLRLSRAEGNLAGEAKCVQNLGAIAEAVGDQQAALRHFQESVNLRRRLGVPSELSVALTGCAAATCKMGDAAAALPYLDEALQIVRTHQDRIMEAKVLTEYAFVLENLGDIPGLKRHLVQAMVLHLELGDAGACGVNLRGLARYVSLADPQRAARMWGHADKLSASLGYDAHLVPYADEAEIAAARAALGDEAFERCWHEGRAMSLDQAVLLATAGER